MRPARRLVPAALFVFLLVVAVGLLLRKTHRPAPVQGSAAAVQPISADVVQSEGETDPTLTTLYAHNLRLRQGPRFQAYIRWIRGKMVRSSEGVMPSLDNPESFVLVIDKGLIHVNIGDVGNFLNTDLSHHSPLSGISITGEGNQIRMRGKLRKLLLALPVEMMATVEPTSDGRVRLHVTKISMLKLPMKGLLRGLHIGLNDLIGRRPIGGLEVSGDDLFFDTNRLLPPPHIRGQLTSIQVERPDLVLIYGGASHDETALSQWHNFLRLQGGSLEFGKLTMQRTDLTLIDATEEAWFDLDLVHYQRQLVSGFIRTTPEAGLEIFMPSINAQNQVKPLRTVTLDWLKDRNSALPPGVSVP